jgi:hypothetical protein
VELKTLDLRYGLPSRVVTSNPNIVILAIDDDSMDLDSDGTYDISFNSHTFVPDFSDECCEYPEDTTILYDCWPTGSVNKYMEVLNSGFQIAVSQNNLISSLSEGDRIDGQLAWENNIALTFIYVHIAPPDVVAAGYWQTDEDKYMGVRKIDTDTTYGWIKMSVGDTISISEVFFGSNRF